jgi:hypothetical protein
MLVVSNFLGVVKAIDGELSVGEHCLILKENIGF